MFPFITYVLPVCQGKNQRGGNFEKENGQSNSFNKMKNIKTQIKRRKLKREVCAKKAMGRKGGKTFAGKTENTKKSKEVKKEKGKPQQTKDRQKYLLPLNEKFAGIASPGLLEAARSNARAASEGEQHL